MERTQIYLTRQETQVLDRLASERRTTRSHLIREAIETQYLAREERVEQALADLQASFGVWQDRDDVPGGELYVERIRQRPGFRYGVALGTDDDQA